MLFNTHFFIFIFLPLSLIVFHTLSKLKLHHLKFEFLIIASLFFYSWWSPKYLFLLLGSISANYILGKWILKKRNNFKLVIGIFFNLIVIGYYKYTNFFIENINLIFETNYILETIILPLGISFFTFQQITYLVDCNNNKVAKTNLMRYFLYVSFFPQMIAGPIVRHNFLMPQILENQNKDVNYNFLNIGITTFTIGLFKKVVLADTLSKFANPFFYFSETGYILNFFDAWAGALIYTFQLYFDFSGYSDMALGIGLMFGFILPVNFYSPFKAKNISEFWICWHVTLSNLVRNYLYFPLSIYFTRKSVQENYNIYRNFLQSLIIPTIISFFLIGLWHGAGWNFVIFGIINGIYIIIYNLWVAFKKKYKIKDNTNLINNLMSQGFTFISIVVALIFFRSTNLDNSYHYLKSIFGLGKFDLIDIFQVGIFAAQPYNGIFLLLISSFIVFLFPNTQESVFSQVKSEVNKDNVIIKRKSFISLKWKPNIAWGLIISSMFLTSVIFLNRKSEFIYFQF